MGLRVVAGRYRGQTLTTPAGIATRPTSDRVREALFSILGDITELRVLDLFAGSGALGIEALSRGAQSAVFVDSAGSAVTAIENNLSRLSLQADVHRCDAKTYLRAASSKGSLFDLVFLDPPYDAVLTATRALDRLLCDVLAEDGWVIVESDRRSPPELNLQLSDERTYGDTLIRFYVQHR